MKELLVRASSGAVYVALVLGAAWAGPLAIGILFLPIACLAAREWHRLVTKNDGSAGGWHLIAIAAISYSAIACTFLFPDPHLPYPLAIISATLILSFVVLLRSGAPEPGSGIGRYLSMVVLVAAPMACAPLLTLIDGSVFIGFMLLLWANDTGAYLVGKAMGRNKLMPKVSPGKTWEGLLGGVIAALASAWAIGTHMDDELSGLTWLTGAVVVSITGTIGDLLESALKRAAGVKDSGTIMPGHGGVLDRFDGYLLAAPAMLITILIMR